MEETALNPTDMMRDALIEVLLDCKRAISRRRSQFHLSPWDSTEEATEQIDLAIEGILVGDINREHLRWLFIPFGPVHQVAIASEWVPDFIDLAMRFDAAFYGNAYKE